MYRTALLLLILLAGCFKVGPEYEPPEVCAPDNWKAPQTCGCQANADDFEFWWEVFEDPILNQLEAAAVENSPTLEFSLQKVAMARAQALEAASALYPNIALNPSYQDIGQLFRIFLPPGVSLPGLTPNALIYRIHQFLYYLPITMNYEVDLWGKISGQVEYQVANLEASQYALESSLLTLTSDLASNYYQLRALDSQIQVIIRTIETRKTDYNLTKSRYEKGIGSRLDLSNAELELANAEALLFDAKRQRALLEDLIATLAGIPASDFCLASNPLTLPPPCIPADLPSDVLLQRPDLAELERQTAASHALIGIAYTSFFPSLSLTGIVGYSSPVLKDFLRWRSRYWQMAAQSNQTIYDAGYNCATVEEAYAQFYAASAQYQQQVLTAFQEVEDALNSIEFLAGQYDSLQKAVNAAQLSSKLVTNRYKNGLVNFYDVVISDRAELSAEQQLYIGLGERYIATVQLIKALGGTWECHN